MAFQWRIGDWINRLHFNFLMKCFPIHSMSSMFCWYVLFHLLYCVEHHFYENNVDQSVISLLLETRAF